ncbi:MAG: hypothetical protein CM15mP120_20980 [Pseudomonadota bacterium]|nr:MAG: hypothetical protein CM15mP120_20980 [Pseudomonadota bacterium]
MRNWLPCLHVATPRAESKPLRAERQIRKSSRVGLRGSTYQSRGQQDGYEDSVEQPTVQANLTKRYPKGPVDFIERNRDQPFLLYLPIRSAYAAVP